MGWYRQMNFDVLGQQIYSCHINKDLETAVTVYKIYVWKKKIRPPTRYSPLKDYASRLEQGLESRLLHSEESS